MGRRKDETPATCSADRIKSLKSRMMEVSGDTAAARDAGSWSAVMGGHRQYQSLRDQYDSEILAQAERAELRREEDRISSLSPEELEREIREHLEAWPDMLLLVALDIGRARGLC